MLDPIQFTHRELITKAALELPSEKRVGLGTLIFMLEYDEFW